VSANNREGNSFVCISSNNSASGRFREDGDWAKGQRLTCGDGKNEVRGGVQAAFLDVIGIKVLRVFFLAIYNHSPLQLLRILFPPPSLKQKWVETVFLT
jgi:hypothetical protein